MVALKRVNGAVGALVRVSGGIEKGQWGHWSGSMGVLKRVNGGTGSMGVLKRINGGIGQGQWGY